MNVTKPAIASWRHPELAVRSRHPEPIDPEERGRLLAKGIADRHTPESAVRWLVDAGEYAVAETVLDEVVGLVEAPAVVRFAGWIDQERRVATARLAVQAQLLRDRADRVGSTVEVDLTEVTDLVRIRRTDAETRVDQLEELIDDLERDEIELIGEEVRERADADTTEATTAWVDQVQALLDAKELPAARRMLESGPGSSPLLPVEEPTAVWPWRTAPLAEILTWFGGATVLAPPGLREYVVDEPGESLLSALRMLDHAPAADAHAALAAAVQELVGVEGMLPGHVPTAGGGHTTTLLVPDDFRLPPLEFAGRSGGLRVTVGSTEPADDSVWLATRLRAERRDGVVVTLADLLGLLQTEKPRSGRPRSISSRRIGLIRTVCRQLPVRAVVPADAFAGANRTELRNQVWWLLHAFGVAPDGVAVDTLLYESGAHPRLLVLALDHVVDLARKQGVLRLEPAVFTALRTSVAYREAVQAELLAELDDEQAAALFTMIFFASADDLRSALDTVVSDVGSELPVDQIVDVAAAAAGLVRHGHVIADGSGRTILCECGITHLLRQGDPHEVAKQALRRSADRRATNGPGTAEARLQDAQFEQHLTEIHLHDERDRADRFEALADASRGSAAFRIRTDRFRREDRQTVDAWRKEKVEIDLVEMCRTVARDIERGSDQVDILVPVSEPVTVVGSRTALRIALRNIIGNAETAVREARSVAQRTVSVRVSVGDDGVEAVVDVEDSGDGIPEAVVRRLVRGEAPASTRHAGDGLGMRGAQVLLLLFGGRLEVRPDRSATLGGAHVRLRIPLPTGATP